MDLVDAELGLEKEDKVNLLADAGVAGQAMHGLVGGVVVGQLFVLQMRRTVRHLAWQTWPHGRFWQRPCCSTKGLRLLYHILPSLLPTRDFRPQLTLMLVKHLQQDCEGGVVDGVLVESLLKQAL